MNMYQLRVLLETRDKRGLIYRTSKNYNTYDAALRNELIKEADNGQAVLTSAGQEAAIATLFTEVGSLWDELMAVRRRQNQMEGGK